MEKVTSNNGAGNLFEPASKSERYLKVLLTGSFGTGKTRAALSFPGPIAVIDLEGGTSLYSEGFDVLRTKDLRRIEQAIDNLAGSKYKTVVIDPITIIWSLLQDAAQTLVERRNDNKTTMETGKALTPREWGLIKREYNSIVTRLINLSMHVVLVTREKDLYEGTGDNMHKIGVQPDTEKGTPYLADFVIHMMTESGPKGDTFYAIVEKSRSPLVPKGKRLTGYQTGATHGLFPLFLAEAAGVHSQGGERVTLDDDAAVAAGNATLMDAPVPLVGLVAAANATEQPPRPARQLDEGQGDRQVAGGPERPQAGPGSATEPQIGSIIRMAYKARGWSEKQTRDAIRSQTGKELEAISKQQASGLIEKLKSELDAPAPA